MKAPSDELFELCKQVYEATGWFEVSDFYVKSFTKKDDFKNALWEIESYSSYAEHMTKEEFSQSNTVPLYTSDYLLEKLPEEIDGYPITLQAINGWQASLCYDGAEDVFVHKAESDTPLKALLKLTLKLHEEGLV